MDRLGLTRDYPKDNYGSQIGDDGNYNVLKGVTFLVDLDESLSEGNSTNTLTHELTVHVDPDLQRIENIGTKIMNGLLKPGTTEYLQQLTNVKNSGDIDHQRLGQGMNKEYKNISAQLDQLKNSKQYSELYEKDVKDH